MNAHKLPGGGIERGEDQITAAQREVQEEMGITITDIREIVTIIEFRSQSHLEQHSHAYLARVEQHLTETAYTEDEKNQGCEPLWVDDITAALDLLAADDIPNYAGHFIQKRDILILTTARELLETN